jgi:hypothetical protein
MVVPEAAVDENDFAPLCEHQIGSPRKFGAVQSVTVAHRRNRFSNNEFRLGIFATYPPHILTAALWANGVHWFSLQVWHAGFHKAVEELVIDSGNLAPLTKRVQLVHG